MGAEHPAPRRMPEKVDAMRRGPKKTDYKEIGSIRAKAIIVPV